MRSLFKCKGSKVSIALFINHTTELYVGKKKIILRLKNYIKLKKILRNKSKKTSLYKSSISTVQFSLSRKYEVMTPISKSPVTFRWKQVIRYMTSATIVILLNRAFSLFFLISDIIYYVFEAPDLFSF